MKQSTPGSAGFGTVEQGVLEGSNVNVVAEITNLITAQRAYEIYRNLSDWLRYTAQQSGASFVPITAEM